MSIIKKNTAKKNPKPKILSIEDDHGIRDLYPGDKYELTLYANMSNDKISGKAEITIKYIWDGKTLKRTHIMHY